MRRPWFRCLCWLVTACALYFFVLVPALSALTYPSTIKLTPREYARLAPDTALISNDTNGPKTITWKLFGFLPIKKVAVELLPFDQILVGGVPIGICGAIDGVLVTADCAPFQTGDVIQAVNAVPVTTVSDCRAQLAASPRPQVTFRRHQQTYQKTLPAAPSLKLRDTTDGVGMLTFINPENHTFSALGHQMHDFDTGTAVNLRGGQVRAVHTYGVEPTKDHRTGMINSAINKNAAPLGSITKGDQFGISGCLTANSPLLDTVTTTIPVRSRYAVKPGPAVIRAALDGVTVEEFTCEILKTRWQNRRQTQSMVIRVTDQRLLQKTGGIIHGMSGSPIIQDGHLVGALTHAMTHDPAKGYAIYVDFMTF